MWRQISVTTTTFSLLKLNSEIVCCCHRPRKIVQFVCTYGWSIMRFTANHIPFFNKWTKNMRCYLIHMSVFSLKWIKLGFTYGLLHKVTICPAFYRSISLIFQILQNRAELFAKDLRYFKKLRLLVAPKNFTTSSSWKTATKKYFQQHTNSCFRVEIVVSTTFCTLIQILCRRIDKSEHLHVKPTVKW